MNKDLMNFLLFCVVCVIIYIVFRNFNFSNKEGLTNNTTTAASSAASSASSANGIAGNSTAYASAIKAATVALQDQLLVSQYQTDYETVILNLDDYISNLMLSTALNINTSSSNNTASFQLLSQLQNSKQALNSVMKFIDSS